MSKQNESALEAPIFVVGSERSGTNLLRRLVAENRADLVTPAPVHLLKHLYYRWGHYVAESQGDGILESFFSDCIKLSTEHWAPWSPSQSAAQLSESYAVRFNVACPVLAIHHYQQTYAEEHFASSYVNKDNTLMQYIPHLLVRIPKARFIFLQRDPADVIKSNLARRSATSSVSRLAKAWGAEQDQLVAGSALVPAKNRVRLTYEDLVLNPRETTRVLASFLGKVEGSGSFAEIDEREFAPIVSDWENLGRPVFATSVGAGLGHLTNRQLNRITQICRSQIKAAGYERPARVDSPGPLWCIWDNYGRHLLSFLWRKLWLRRKDPWAVRRWKLSEEIKGRK